MANNSKTLYSKTIVDKLDLLKKAVIIKWDIKRKRFVIACN